MTSRTESKPSAEEVEEQPQSPPPTSVDGGYGWVCVATTFLINAHTWGLNSSYGVFLAYYLEHNVFPGATRVQYAFTIGFSISQALLISPVATFIAGKWGNRTLLIMGVILESASFIAASFASRVWQLLLSQGLCFGWGSGFLFTGTVGIISQWFDKRRSLANGISASGSGFGGLTYSLATHAMIQNLGLAWTFRILSIVAFVVNLVCALLLKDRHKQVGSKVVGFDIKLFRRPEYLLLLGFGFFSMMGYTILLYSIPNYARSVGMTAKQGSIVGAVLNLGQGLGRPPIGFFSDSFGRINMAGATTFFSALMILVVWTNAKTFGVLIFYALVGGMVAGTFWPVVAPVVTEVVGLQDLPAGLSIMWIVLAVPTAFAEPIGLQIVSFNGGSYLGAQILTGVMYATAACCLWFVKAWKVGELERVAARESAALSEVDPVGSTSAPDLETIADPRSPYLKRMLRWCKV